MTGGTTYGPCTVRRSAVPPDGVPRFDESDPRRISAAGPARSLRALAQRLGVTEAEAAAVVTPLAEEPAPVVASPTAEQASPLLPMTGRNGASSAPKTLLNRKQVIVARKGITQ